jgi:hypothetical protein
MKKILALAAASAVALATFCTTASAETDDERMQKAPTKTMGNEGKLPATDQMSTSVPDMGTAEPAPDGGGPAGQKGPAMRMGNDGKLPATNNMSGQLPAR